MLGNPTIQFSATPKVRLEFVFHFTPNLRWLQTPKGYLIGQDNACGFTEQRSVQWVRLRTAQSAQKMEMSFLTVRAKPPEASCFGWWS